MKNKHPLYVKIGAVAFTFTLMAVFVAFHAGAFEKSTRTDIFGDPDSTKRDTVFTDAGINLVDSTFVIPVWVYSSKAMVSHYELEFDSVFVETIKYGSLRSNEIVEDYFSTRVGHNMEVQVREKQRKFMGSSKFAPAFEPEDTLYERDENPNKK